MTIRKITIFDDDKLRQELDSIYERCTQEEISRWAILLSKHCFAMLNMDYSQNEVVIEGFQMNEKRICLECRMHDVRMAGFKIHELARKSGSFKEQLAYRIAGQAVGTAHMKEHGMVASDYAIKLINLLYPHDLESVLRERKWQIAKLKEIVG